MERDSNPHASKAGDFKSPASTNSATHAFYAKTFPVVKEHWAQKSPVSPGLDSNLTDFDRALPIKNMIRS